MNRKCIFIAKLWTLAALSPTAGYSEIRIQDVIGEGQTKTTPEQITQPSNSMPSKHPHQTTGLSLGTSLDNKPEQDLESKNEEAQQEPKKLYLKFEPRVYNKEFNTETYGATIRLGAVIQGANSTTILEIGPQILDYRSDRIFSIDSAIETYWSISNKVEVYGRWYPSYVDGYGRKDFYNSVAAGAVLRLNGGVVDVNQYTGLASLTKGQYLKVEQQLSTYKGFSWSGSRTAARVGWAARGSKWSLALEAGIAYDNDIFQGVRYRPSGVFEFNYTLNKDTSMVFSYYPTLSAGFNGPTRGELGLAIVQRF